MEPFDKEFYEQARAYEAARKQAIRDGVSGAAGAASDIRRGMSAADARAKWQRQYEGVSPEERSEIDKRLGEIAKLEAELKAKGDEVSSSERIKLAQMKHDARAAALAHKAEQFRVQGDMAKARMAAQLAAVEHDKAALAKELPPAEPTPAILEKAGKWAQQYLSDASDPLTAAGQAVFGGGELDTLTVATLAQDVAGMSTGEKSAFIDAIAQQRGVDPSTLVQSLNALANGGDANAIMLVREYQADKSAVQTKHAQYADLSKNWADDVKEIARKTGVRMSDAEVAEFAKQFEGGTGVEVGHGSSGSGQPEGQGDARGPLDDERDRLLDRADALERADDSTPEMLKIKKQMMADPRFQMLMEQNGWTDPEQGFRAMMRSVRPAFRSERQLQRKNEYEERKAAGMNVLPEPFAPSGPRKIAPTLPTEIRDRLTGVEKKRAAEEEAFRESMRQQGWNLPQG